MKPLDSNATHQSVRFDEGVLRLDRHRDKHRQPERESLGRYRADRRCCPAFTTGVYLAVIGPSGFASGLD